MAKKRTKHICGVEGILHDPAECPACDRVEAGEPALGVPDDEPLTDDEQALLLGFALSACDEMDGTSMEGEASAVRALVAKAETGRLVVRHTSGSRGG